jgi:3-oxoacyl-[acyl-carrier-protein] synthase III
MTAEGAAPPRRRATVTGWGTALPDKVVTNADLEATLDTSDAWITERTGIKERRVGGTTVGLSVEAGRRALERAGVEPGAVDLVILATTTPDQQMPASASAVQEALGLDCGAFDVNAACSGFVYAAITAAGLVATGMERILVIGADTMTRILDWDDRNTAILFGDGAGAAVLEATDAGGGLLAWNLHSDGSARKYLYADLGGYIQMEGREVFRRAVRVIVDSCEATMAAAGVGPDDIALLVPHQANIRIIDAACQRLGIPLERAVNNLERVGNTSAGSIPLALAEGADAGMVADGDLVLMVGFGAGMTAASAVLRWGR